MTESERLLRRRDAVVPRGVPQVTRATAASARGARIVDADGRELIDLAAGIGVMNAGHCDDGVVRAIREQAGTLLHVCFHVATYEPYVALCERLAALLPHGDRTKVLLVNSGAEAVDNAVKIARQATGRSGIICYSNAFHGRTYMGMTLTSKVGTKMGCGPFVPDVHRIPFPEPARAGASSDEGTFIRQELDRLEGILDYEVCAADVAGVVLEPVQGEGGFIPVPRGYLHGLREICDRHGILLILDEIQTGFCRTGHWGAYQHYGVVPDLSTWAKSMGGGLPIAAVVGRAEVMDRAAPGTIGGTYGGNPVACAAALATIDVMERLDLNRRAGEVGRRVRDRFLSMQARSDAVADVRGLGAMVAMELVETGKAGEGRGRPASTLAARLVEDCLERGVLIIPAGIHGNVIRVLSPLVITDDELDRGLDILEEAFFRLSPERVASAR